MLDNRIQLKKKCLFTIICLLCCSMFVACGKKADKNGSMIAEDGRSYGGLILSEAGEEVNTAFFDVIVTDVTQYDTYQFDDGLYQAEDGMVYLVVTLTIKNTYDENLPMSITDFTLNYDGNKSENIITGYGKADLNQDNFMENIFTLKKDETITKSILFTVEKKTDYTLNYTEFYEDEFKGDSYEIKMTPKMMSSNETASSKEQESTTTSE